MSKTLNVSRRSETGKYVAFNLRKAGQIPGIIYGLSGQPNKLLSLPQKEFMLFLKLGERMVDLNIDGERQPAILFDVQHGTFDHEIMHVDFKPVDENQPINLEVEIVLKGADEAPGVAAGGVLAQQLFHVEIRCLPRNLPEHIVVDASKVNLDQIIHVSDLPQIEGVEYHSAPGTAVLSCHLPAGEEALEETTETSATEE